MLNGDRSEMLFGRDPDKADSMPEVYKLQYKIFNYLVPRWSRGAPLPAYVDITDLPMGYCIATAGAASRKFTRREARSRHVYAI